MTTTDTVNTLLKEIDFGSDFIAVRVKNDKKTLIYSNMPDDYKSYYYQNSLNNIDDTFDRAEEQDGVLYPCSAHGYQSDYVTKMEEFGFFNQSAFAVKVGSIVIGCITTSRKLYPDFEERFEKHKADILTSVVTLLTHFRDDVVRNFIDTSEDIKDVLNSLSSFK